MRRFASEGVVLVIALLCGAWSAAADLTAEEADDALQTASSPPFLLTPPKQDGPTVVHAAFELRDIQEIDDVEETFEFNGVLTLRWNDPRQAFEPAEGAKEKIFQGDYQFHELAARWYPQLVLVNEAGSYEKSGVVLRVAPDGTSTLIETITAAAETDLDMRRFPFDRHRLEAVFEVLGFDRDEILLQLESASEASVLRKTVRLPQWSITRASTEIRDRITHHREPRGVSSAFVLNIDVERESIYIERLIAFPLLVIVLLSFSVFWMDRSSIGDRISVSFIGILTGVSYQLVMGSIMPRISYVTLMHGFLMLSFLTMSTTVVINLVVSELDKRGKVELGDRIDRRCRWIFPLFYFGLILVILGVASVL